MGGAVAGGALGGAMFKGEMGWRRHGNAAKSVGNGSIEFFNDVKFNWSISPPSIPSTSFSRGMMQVALEFDRSNYRIGDRDIEFSRREPDRAPNLSLTLLTQRLFQSPNATVSRFVLTNWDGDDLWGYFLEPGGPSSTEEGSDQRILPGTYDMIWRVCPQCDHTQIYVVANVPGRTAILMHTGNYTTIQAAVYYPARIMELKMGITEHFIVQTC